MQQPPTNPNQRIPNGIYYVTHTDLVGSTEYTSRMGNAALELRVNAFVDCCRTALEHAKIGQNSGLFVKSIGDGVLMVFNHFPDIVQWWLELDPLLHLACPDDRLRARIRVHAGEVRFCDGDTTALAVNQVVKMAKAAKHEEFVVSETARALALPSMFPKQCIFEKCDASDLDDSGGQVVCTALLSKRCLPFSSTREQM